MRKELARLESINHEDGLPLNEAEATTRLGGQRTENSDTDVSNGRQQVTNNKDEDSEDDPPIVTRTMVHVVPGILVTDL